MHNPLSGQGAGRRHRVAVSFSLSRQRFRTSALNIVSVSDAWRARGPSQRRLRVHAMPREASIGIRSNTGSCGPPPAVSAMPRDSGGLAHAGPKRRVRANFSTMLRRSWPCWWRAWKGRLRSALDHSAVADQKFGIFRHGCRAPVNGREETTC